ncbi:MAG: hypothetical protein HRT70_02540 [Flavobacteriaceae bacterium]|nr:hypothetical protein [Flavobacteriaceae bacterium]
MRRSVLRLFLIISLKVASQAEDFKHISFHKADSIAASHLGATLKSIPKLSFLLTKDLETDVEKLRSIFMWITTNTSNDHSVYEKNKRKRKQFKNNAEKLQKWNRYILKKNLSKLLKKKKTICTGYAYLLKEMCAHINLQCKIIDGFGRTAGLNTQQLAQPNHSWNAVLLNNKWYVCDPTWASGITNPNTHKLDVELQKGYFLTQPELFIKNHFPENLKWTLLQNNNTTFDSFLEEPLVYGAAFQYKTLNRIPKKMFHTVTKKERIPFHIQPLEPAAIDQVHLMISTKREHNLIVPKNLVVDQKNIRFDHKFLYRGFYDVHLMIDEKVIMTYVFEVKK